MKHFYLLFLLLSFAWSHAQFFEDFEGDTFPPPGWTISSNLVNTPVQWTTSDGVYAITGTKSAFMSRYNIGPGNTSEDWLITPPITVSEDFNLYFFSRTTLAGNQGTLYDVRVSTSSDPNDLNSYVLLHQYTENTLNPSGIGTYDINTLSLEDFENQTIHIAFIRVFAQTGSPLGGDRWILDNIIVDSEMILDCNSSFDIRINNLSHNSVNIGWSNPSIGDTYQVFFTDDPNETPNPNQNFIGSSSLSRIFNNLICNHTYYFYVRTKCKDNEVSDWSESFVFTTSPCFVRLIAFLDYNSNGIRDAGEPTYSDGFFEYDLTNTGTLIQGFSSTGILDVIIEDTTLPLHFGFTVFEEYQNEYQCLQTYSNVTFDQNNHIYTFPVNVINPICDVSIAMSSMIPRAGNNYVKNITYKNHSNITVSGTITYTKDPVLTINNTTVASIPNDLGFTYNYTNLQPGETRTFNVTSSVPAIPNVQLGQILTNSVSISTNCYDINLSNNTTTSSKVIVAAYDPNDKNEDRGPQIHIDDFEVGDDLYYTIRFQNTGNANALTVRIEDVLDPQLNPATVRMISSSHDYILTRNQNFLEWTFNDIDLVPESVDELESIGYVYFKIKPFPGFTVGSVIPNTASIFFDTNPPIITNTFQTEFVDQLSVPSLEATHFQLYPNPVKEMVYIQSTSTETLSSIRLFNILGKEVLQLNNIQSNATQINLSGLPSGIYLMELTSESGTSSTQKVVKQ